MLRYSNRFNQTFQPEEVPQALAVMSLHDIQDAAWYPDTGASAHMTSDPDKLHTLSNYMGPDKIIVGDGNALDITHIGSTNVKVGDASLHLDNVLVVPSIKKN